MLYAKLFENRSKAYRRDSLCMFSSYFYWVPSLSNWINLSVSFITSLISKVEWLKFYINLLYYRVLLYSKFHDNRATAFNIKFLFAFHWVTTRRAGWVCFVLASSPLECRRRRRCRYGRSPASTWNLQQTHTYIIWLASFRQLLLSYFLLSPSQTLLDCFVVVWVWFWIWNWNWTGTGLDFRWGSRAAEIAAAPAAIIIIIINLLIFVLQPTE